ncbi:hypothetical protein M1N24_02930, partial [Dehalococcoidia bacterium]|nr:hypothetical protein [Dehalococcoidia bacterium]
HLRLGQMKFLSDLGNRTVNHSHPFNRSSGCRYIQNWSQRSDLNRRPAVYETELGFPYVSISIYEV